MHDRAALGTADVTDRGLTELVAALVGRPADEVTLLDSHATEVEYDLSALTTAGRYWVRGEALVDGRRQSFGFFVKHVQSWSRSPLFAEVPTELVEMAEAGVPWRTEPLVYRSDLGSRLPTGLRMPRAYGVFDLDEKSASLWLEVIETVPAEWDAARFSRAAHLLGRLAASPRVRERDVDGEPGGTVYDYLHGRLANQVIPRIRDADLWRHPLLARTFGDALRGRLQDAADRADDLADELVGLPLASMHGDACPNNLLVTADDEGFVLIDYGFFCEGPIGFDLGQLIVGDVQLGRQPASSLPSVEAAVVPAYVEGLRAEGCEVPLEIVRRAHALHLVLFTGLSALPFEYLGAQPTPVVYDMASERAAIARFSLNLLEATSRPHSTS